MRKTRVLPQLIVAFLLFPNAAPAATAPADPALARALASIRPEAISSHMRFLADDLLEGRGTGTRGYDIAAAYVASQFEGVGLEPAGIGGTWFQAVPFVKTRTVEPECSLAFVRAGRRRALAYGSGFVMAGDLARERQAVSAPAVFVGFGIRAPELRYDDYAGVDVKGKIVVMLSGAPPTFPHNQRAYYSSTQVKEELAAARGAVGILGVRTPVDEARAAWDRVLRQNRLPGMRWTEPGGAPHGYHPEIRIAALLSRAGAETLFAGAPRSLAQVFAAADSGRAHGFALPVEVRARRGTRLDRATSPNVVGLLRGSDAKRRGEFVVYTSHLDHLGVSTPVEGDSINNGAYDNASGVALMLEIARAFRRLPRGRRSILFVAVTGEEKGLQGSEYFSRFPTVPESSIVANVNMDMFLMLHPLRDIVAFGAEHSSLGPVVERAARALGLRVSPDPVPQEVIFIRSDQYSFVREGIPAVFPVGGLGATQEEAEAGQRWLQATYHSPQDDMRQTMDFAAGVKFAQLNLLIGRTIADAPARPRWNEGDFFGEKFGRAGGGGRAAPHP